jgi:AI-2 transport protein TqsA
MNIKSIGSIESSHLVKLAALIVILAGMIYAKTIIAPFLLALFISIICMQPITWLEKKRLPRGLAIVIVILGLILIFFGFTSLIGGSLSFFVNNVSKHESTISKITDSMIQFFNNNGFNIPKDQVSKFIQPEKIMEFTTIAIKELFIMLGNAFLIFLIILFILMEFGSFSVKTKAITRADKSTAYFTTILKEIRHYLGIKNLSLFIDWNSYLYGITDHRGCLLSPMGIDCRSDELYFQYRIHYRNDSGISICIGATGNRWSIMDAEFVFDYPQCTWKLC